MPTPATTTRARIARASVAGARHRPPRASASVARPRLAQPWRSASSPLRLRPDSRKRSVRGRETNCCTRSSPSQGQNGGPGHSRRRTEVARPERLELPTPRSVVWCSIQLSYGRSQARGCSGRPPKRQEARAGAPSPPGEPKEGQGRCLWTPPEGAALWTPAKGGAPSRVSGQRPDLPSAHRRVWRLLPPWGAGVSGRPLVRWGFG